MHKIGNMYLLGVAVECCNYCLHKELSLLYTLDSLQLSQEVCMCFTVTALTAWRTVRRPLAQIDSYLGAKTFQVSPSRFHVNFRTEVIL